MQSERSTTELHPLLTSTPLVIYYYHCHTRNEVITHISQCWLHVFIGIFEQHTRLVLKGMEKVRIEPRTFHMQSERSTTELHPLLTSTPLVIYYYHCHTQNEVITHISQCWLHVFIGIF